MEILVEVEVEVEVEVDVEKQIAVEVEVVVDSRDIESRGCIYSSIYLSIHSSHHHTFKLAREQGIEA